MRVRGMTIGISVLSLAVLALTSCSTGGSSGGSGSNGSGGNGSGAGGAPAATATFTGDISGVIEMNLCTDSGADSIFVLVKGDSTKYPGSVSPNGLGFVGPDAKAWARDLTSSPTLPTAITTGSGGYVVDGVHAYYELPGATTEEITISGKLLCP